MCEQRDKIADDPDPNLAHHKRLPAEQVVMRCSVLPKSTLWTESVERFSGEDVLAWSSEAVQRAYADIYDHVRAYADIYDRVRASTEKGEDPVIDIGVTYNETWMKKGFASLYGMGIVLDVLTDLVLDYDVLSKYCYVCKLQEVKNQVIKIHGVRKRLEEKLSYTVMLRDVDSSAYVAVYNDAPYGRDGNDSTST